MCNRHHQPEPFTISGMPVVICDDIPTAGFGGHVFSDMVIVGGGPNGDEGVSITAGQEV